MMINIILLVIWLFLGFLVFLSAEDGKISVWLYFACWIVLILQLIMNILERMM